MTLRSGFTVLVMINAGVIISEKLHREEGFHLHLKAERESSSQTRTGAASTAGGRAAEGAPHSLLVKALECAAQAGVAFL